MKLCFSMLIFKSVEMENKINNFLFFFAIAGK